MFYVIADKTKLFGHVGVMFSYCVIYLNMRDTVLLFQYLTANRILLHQC